MATESTFPFDSLTLGQRRFQCQNFSGIRSTAATWNPSNFVIFFRTSTRSLGQISLDTEHFEQFTRRDVSNLQIDR